MNMLVFFLLAIAWLMSMLFAFERKTVFSSYFVSIVSFIFGVSLLASGIDFQTGYTITTVSPTVSTIVQLTTNLSPANTPLVFGLGWGSMVLGIFGLIHSTMRMLQINLYGTRSPLY